MYYNFIEKNHLLCSIILFLAIFGLIILGNPSYLFNSENITEDVVNILDSYSETTSFSNSKKLLDLTSGRSTLLTLGYSNKEIIRSITDQLKKFPHIDCNIYENPQAEVLSNLLIKFGTNGLNKVYYSGSNKNLATCFELWCSKKNIEFK